MLRLLRNAELFAPEPRGRCDVLVAGERIVAIAESLAPATGLPIEIWELAGAHVVPGLVDGHVHVTGGGGEAGTHTKVPPLSAESLAHAGITTAIGVLGTDATTRSVRELVAAVLGLRARGLSAWCCTGSYELPVPTVTGSVRGDLAFVDPIVGVGELAISDHRSSQPTLAEILRVAADVHVGGMLADKAGVLHLHLGDGARGLELVRAALDGSELPPSVFHPTHVNRNPRLFEEAIALACERGCTIDVTAFPDEDLGDALPADRAIAICLERGVPIERITCSSDGGGCMPTFDREGRLVAMGVGRPGTIAEALRRLVTVHHLPLHVALLPFTSNVARTFRLPRKGRLVPGADADLVILDEHARVRGVIARGEPWLRDGAAMARGLPNLT